MKCNIGWLCSPVAPPSVVKLQSLMRLTDLLQTTSQLSIWGCSGMQCYVYKKLAHYKHFIWKYCRFIRFLFLIDSFFLSIWFQQIHFPQFPSKDIQHALSFLTRRLLKHSRTKQMLQYAIAGYFYNNHVTSAMEIMLMFLFSHSGSCSCIWLTAGPVMLQEGLGKAQGKGEQHIVGGMFLSLFQIKQALVFWSYLEPLL